VYGRVPGSVAAPTAGLHFTPEVLAGLQARGVPVFRIVLHVGPGTFTPVREEDVRLHRMESEYFEISDSTAEGINRAAAEGRRIVAVGTTTVRTLESAARGRRVQPCRKTTDLFIVPGYQFNIVDALLTNFHLPRSTLLMLVCAFAGTEIALAAYKEAVKEKYRFYSYGDACLILD
jgi:S-adenosylmethionine:tRNA ribosyltransferase-isomerase